MCCESLDTTSDFDVSADNATWFTGYKLTVPAAGKSAVRFRVRAPVRPTMVRYTANKVRLLLNCSCSLLNCSCSLLNCSR